LHVESSDAVTNLESEGEKESERMEPECSWNFSKFPKLGFQYLMKPLSSAEIIQSPEWEYRAVLMIFSWP